MTERARWTTPVRHYSPAVILILVLAEWGAAAAAAVVAAADPTPPNIVLILVDDQGYYDLGCYGATEFRTPRIDELAAQGIRFTDYYAAAPICSPSRAGLMTGCYPRRVGNHIWVHRADSVNGIHPDELTIAELLQENGYATACIGKWHLGFADSFLPHAQGFDHYFGLLHNLDPVETTYFGEAGVPLIRNGEVIRQPADPAELTGLYTDEALRFIRANKERPFFLYLPHTMLHNPLGVSDEFRGSSQFGEYGDAVQELDHHVGRIVDELKAQRLSDQTVIIYVSDNGRGPGRSPEQPLRGRKLSTLEAGIRVPAIAWGPGVGLSQGARSDAVVRAMDWYPTLATLAGIEVPEGRVLDGRDLTTLLRGETRFVSPPGAQRSLNAGVPLRRTWNPPGEWAPLVSRNEYNDAFFYHGTHGETAAVRWRQWKLQLNPSLQLFDLSSDPAEQQPVRNGEIIRKLRGMVVLFQHEMLNDARAPGEGVPPLASDRRTSLSGIVTSGLNSRLGVTYARYGERELKMDIYRPKQAWGALPAVVCIHGGGWANGDRTSHAALAQAIAAKGFVAATISYRLSGEAPFPAAIHDCKAAVRFLRSRAGELGIDADRIGAAGLSAGGHLTALLAVSDGVEQLEGNGGHSEFSSSIQAAVPMGAQTDLLSERTRAVSASPVRGEIWQQFFQGSLSDNPDVYRLASPRAHLNAGDPPMLFITGEKDDPSTRAAQFRAGAAEADVQTDLLILEGAPHAFLGRQRWFDRAVERAAGFFRRTLTEAAP